MSVTSKPGDTYEFDKFQNSIFRPLAGAMRFVGAILVLAGLFYGVLGTLAFSKGRSFDGLVFAVQGGIDLLLGGYVRRAARSFQQIVDTSLQDIRHLMAALEELRGYFSLQRVLIVIALIAVAVTIPFSLP